MSTILKNVLMACALLHQAHVPFQIYSINAEPACVFRVDRQLWYYDGRRGSNQLQFMPSNPIKVVLPTKFNTPINGCLILALVYCKNHPKATLTISNHHAQATQ